ncbi:hypothetical protein CRYUN_Cryun38cG0074200 [Craigia yunnanensis]
MCYLQKAYQFLCLVLFFLNFQSNLSSSYSSSITQLCSHDEASSLIQFKSSFSTNEGHSWDCDDVGIKSYSKTDSWKEGTDCCSWDGVTCDNIKGQVIGLDLSCSLLHGSIPSNSSLFHLPHLQKLNLAFNYFNFSKMSSKFVEFASLVYLNLSGSYFAGQVPSQISHLSKLVSLDLSQNYDQILDRHTLEGLVHNLTKVRQFFLDGTNMSSINPNVLMNLSSSLISLSLNGCSLRGKFPQNIFHLPNLKMLNLGCNKNLSLSLPKSNRSSHLKVLDLSAMSFSRKLIDSIDNLVYLEYLDVSGAIFSAGRLPDSIGNLISLKFLDLGWAQISGSIPKALGNLSNLIYLNLAGNYLSGKIPSSLIRNLTQLEFLDIGANQLEGSIPDEVSASPNLICLFLFLNLLSGTLPSWLYTISSLKTNADYTLPNLQSLSLSSCNASKFPRFLRGSKSLLYLDLSDNRIYGKIPKWLPDVGKDSLYYLNLSHNSLTNIEQLPWKKIQFLDLSSNLIHGDLPIPPLTTIRFLISNNSFSGEISSLICNASSLGLLDLSHNNLSGIIPQCFGYLSQSVWSLNLQKNKFHGIIPPTFTKGCQLVNLNLNGNQLEGPLTRSIINCEGLKVLDLGNNRINDTFPHWL